MKKLLFLLTVSAITFASCDKDNNDDNLNQTDRDFMMKASYGNNAEVAAGQMAVTKGENDAVVNFGQMMVDDHSGAQAELKGIAMNFSMNLPTDLDSAHKALSQQLDTLSGYKFDSVYIASQVKDHEKTIALFQNAADNGSESQVKNYAKKYLPKLQMHLEKAKEVQNNLTEPVTP